MANLVVHQRNQRINITVPYDDLVSIDRYAEEHGLTRSSFMVACTMGYLADCRSKRDSDPETFDYSALANMLSDADITPQALFDYLHKSIKNA